MHHLTALLVVPVIVSGAWSSVAQAIPCYSVLDQKDTVIYRGVPPPIDMSLAGTSARDALRDRGFHLLTIESDQCPEVSNGPGPGGTSVASVEEIVAGYRSFMVNKAGYNPSVSGGVRGGGGAAPTPVGMPGGGGPVSPVGVSGPTTSAPRR